LFMLFIIACRERPPETPSCDSTLPGCEERFFNRTTAEDIERVGGILNRSLGGIAEGIVRK